LRRHPRLKKRSRFDQVADGFRLGQIDSAVQECAQSKLAWLGGARSQLETSFHNVTQNHRRAVAPDFHDVFSSVGMWTAKAGDHHPVQNAAGFRLVKFSQRRMLRFERGLRKTNESGRNFNGPVPGKADDSDAAPAGRGCDGRDGVVGWHREEKLTVDSRKQKLEIGNWKLIRGTSCPIKTGQFPISALSTAGRNL